MADKHQDRCKTIGHELQQHVVVPFPGKVAVVRERPLKRVAEPYRLFRFRLTNGFAGAASLLGRDAGRIWRLVREPKRLHSFVVFDSQARRIGLNLRYVACWQLDGHAGAGLLADALPDTSTVDIVFSDSKEPLHIEVEPDQIALSHADYRERCQSADDDAAAALVQVAILFSYCESTRRDSDYVECLRDASCSAIGIRLNDVALVSAPVGHIRRGGFGTRLQGICPGTKLDNGR